MQLNAISMNCRGLRDFDIIFLQEVHCDNRNDDKIKSDWKTYRKDDHLYFSHGTSASKGVLTIIKHSLTHYIKAVDTDTQGRWVIVGLKICGTEYSLFNIYAPNLD